jgi:hypothetical protein
MIKIYNEKDTEDFIGKPVVLAKNYFVLGSAYTDALKFKEEKGKSGNRVGILHKDNNTFEIIFLNGAI